MKKIKYLMSIAVVIGLFFISTPAKAAENPAFGSLNNYKSFLTQIYNAAITGDIITAKSYDGTELAAQMYNEMQAMGINDYYLIMDGTTTTGTGIGVHCQNGGYGFYVGQYVNGKREGNGVFFYNTNVDEPMGYLYYSYRGEWKNDLPNGNGQIIEPYYNDNIEEWYIVLRSGTFLNGYEHGEMMMTYGHYVYGPLVFLYHAENGVLSPSFATILDEYDDYNASLGIIPEGGTPFTYLHYYGYQYEYYYMGVTDFQACYNANPHMKESEEENDYTVYTIAKIKDPYFNPEYQSDPYHYEYWGIRNDSKACVSMFK